MTPRRKKLHVRLTFVSVVVLLCLYWGLDFQEETVGNTKPSSRNNQGNAYFSSSIHMKDYCVKLIQGSANKKLIKWAAHHWPLEEERGQYTNAILQGCDDFLSLGDYVRKPLNYQEESFPIAYAIVMYKDPEQVERLLHAIYRPQNHYCIHVDSKVS